MLNSPFQKNNFPVSCKETSCSELRSVSLALSRKKHFLIHGDLPPDYDLFDSLCKRFPAGFVVNGAPVEFANLVVSHGGAAISLGQEALVKLPFKPGSGLKDLIRRGRREHSVILPESDRATSILTRVQEASVYRNRRKLRFLFRSDPLLSDYFCAAVTEDEKAVALLTASRITATNLHLDLMCRREDASAGVMELLFEELSKLAVADGIHEINLGEVPFTGDSHILGSRSSRLCLKLTELAIAGYNRINSGWYNYQGLYRFKNKFGPRWRPVYWCFWPKASYLDLVEIAGRTEALSLSISNSSFL